MRSEEPEEQSRHRLRGFPEDVLDELVRPDLGLVVGRPVIRVPVIDDDAIEGMNEAELRTFLRLLSHGYEQAWAKLMQFTNYVPAEVCKRDPGAAVAVWMGAKSGKTDEQMARELGETVRFVQRVRLGIDTHLKKPRGRPRRSP